VKSVGKMSIGELAAFVNTHLEKNGVRVVLTGGSCVTIYSKNTYVSYDLDFIEDAGTDKKRIGEILKDLGFSQENRNFIHPETPYYIEFPPGPLSIGAETVKQVDSMVFETGLLNLLSPTDCVKDRLAAYYHWNDLQCLEQALTVAEHQEIDLSEVMRWSNEGMQTKFNEIKERLQHSIAQYKKGRT